MLVGRCPRLTLLLPGGTDGPLSSSEWAGVLIPAVPAGPVGLVGTLSPTDCVSGILVDPGGMFPSSDLARMRGPTPPAGSTVLMVGPAISLWVFPLSHSESACIMDLSAGGTLSPSKSDLTGPDDLYVTGGPVGQIGSPRRPPHRKYWLTLAGR